jgi:hypothetical protein
MSFKETAGREAFRPLGDNDIDVARLLELLERALYRICTYSNRTSWSRPSRGKERDLSPM